VPAVKVHRDEHGALYRVQPFTPDQHSLDVRKDPSRKLQATPGVDVWWDRDFPRKDNELVVLRQENDPKRADVIQITQGQVYDLIHALGWVIKDI
jgi:hypothetical protein